MSLQRFKVVQGCALWLVTEALQPSAKPSSSANTCSTHSTSADVMPGNISCQLALPTWQR